MGINPTAVIMRNSGFKIPRKQNAKKKKMFRHGQTVNGNMIWIGILRMLRNMPPNLVLGLKINNKILTIFEGSGQHAVSNLQSYPLFNLVFFKTTILCKLQIRTVFYPILYIKKGLLGLWIKNKILFLSIFEIKYMKIK